MGYSPHSSVIENPAAVMLNAVLLLAAVPWLAGCGVMPGGLPYLHAAIWKLFFT